MITKEQFIKDYYKSRENSDYVVKYDFSLLPDIIPTQQTKVTVICLEEFVDGMVGECQTTYATLVKISLMLEDIPEERIKGGQQKNS